jgi:hypothetical protein
MVELRGSWVGRRPRWITCVVLPLSGSYVRAEAEVGRINARTSAETLRPESRVLASGVRPSVPPYQALIRIPATATASAARAAPPAACVTRTAAIGDPRCCTIPVKGSSPCAADCTGKLTVGMTRDFADGEVRAVAASHASGARCCGVGCVRAECSGRRRSCSRTAPHGTRRGSRLSGH